MCDDADFALPTDENITNLSYAPQSEDFDLPVEDQPIATVGDENTTSCIAVDNTHDVYFGEVIRSFRTLLKRYNFHTSYLAPNGPRQMFLIVPNFPHHRGLWANGINVTAAVVAVNYVHMTMMNYLTPAFVGMRGGIRSKYVYFTDKDSYVGTMTIANNTVSDNAFANFSSVHVTTDNSTFSKGRLVEQSSLIRGAEATITKLMPSMEVEHPYYTRYRFTNNRYIGQGGNISNPLAQTHVVSIQSDATSYAGVDRYVSIGEDFSLFLFQGAPTVVATVF